jgi:hypothetical protein
MLSTEQEVHNGSDLKNKFLSVCGDIGLVIPDWEAEAGGS